MSPSNQYHLPQGGHWSISEDAAPQMSPESSSPCEDPLYHMNPAPLRPYATSMPSSDGVAPPFSTVTLGDENVWFTPYGTLGMTQPAHFFWLAVPTGPSAIHSEANIHVDPDGNVNIHHQVNSQVVLVPVMYPAHSKSRELGVHGAGTTREQPEFAQFFTKSTTNGPVPVGRPMNATVPMEGVGLLDPGPIGPSQSSNPPPEGAKRGVGDNSTHAGTHLSSRRTILGRRAPVRSPGRTVEANLGILCARLLAEGADIEAVEYVRDVIFPGSVSEDALMAPINTYEGWNKYGRATKVWQLLLITKEVVPGKKSYCCRLCPEAYRPEYKYGRDAVRHFKKEHFGFAVPFWRSGRKYYKEAERKRHANVCRQKPKTTLLAWVPIWRPRVWWLVSPYQRR